VISLILTLGALLGGLLALWGAVWWFVRRHRSRPADHGEEPTGVDAMVARWHAGERKRR
jgi:hypothetical protein